MFEITADDIALLDDENLRSLVGRLCESEVRNYGFSASFVTWGGHQNAADGGLDVRVALPPDAKIGGFVPCPATGFQVKKSGMSRSDILAEMRPKGVLRPAIRDLADRSGAYVIVSSSAWASDIPLQKRRAAMSEAVQDLPSAAGLALDFYDRGRVATWVRHHPGLVLWVREKIGKPIHRWFPYGDWAHDPEGERGEYLLDDKLRILTNTQEAVGGLHAAEGVKLIRYRLRNPRSVVRLVGLSGVGKTRLLQALFDGRVGEGSLDPTLACYTNIADEPEPRPLALTSELIAKEERAILIIDNCPPDLHQRLSELCRSPESQLSLVTVEYDVREDEPEGTDVFSLEPSSIDLIEKLVKRRIPALSPVDARTIADFSGGNARVAVVLADTLAKNETITGLTDEALFKRLFQQRNDPNESLFLAAQALSLVYSFQGEDVAEGNQTELDTLGALIGKNAQEMFRHAVDLGRRHLLQKRGPWRAVLPHAIANRLAAVALQNIPLTVVEKWIINDRSEHLLKSFSRRLGYLNNSAEAGLIVRKWLSPGGLLGGLPDLSDLGYAIFCNIAPVAPEDALMALERVLLESADSEVATKCNRYLYVIRLLAHDAAMFERCITLILKIAEVGEADDDSNEAWKIFASLFPIYLSGTHATIDQRLIVAKSLLLSEDPKRRAIGLTALRAALEATHFGSAYSFEFGARSRDYGYRPRHRHDAEQWFGKALRLAETFACADDPCASQVRNVIAEQFRGLWAAAAMYDELEQVCHAISRQSFWSAGWIAVRQTIFYDSKSLAPEISARLAALESSLRPTDLVQKIRSIVLSDALIYIGLESTDDGFHDIGNTMAQVGSMACELGRAAAQDQDTLTGLLPELVVGNSQQLWNFGAGLSEGCGEPTVIWSQLVIQFGAAPANKRRVQMLCGFLNALTATNPTLVDALLDDSLENGALRQIYPVLQTAVGIDKEGVNRLMRSLELGKAPIANYHNLVSGGVTHQISARDFANLLLRIAEEPGGLEIAIEILGMRIYFGDGLSSPTEISDLGCELLRNLKFTEKRNDVASYRIGMVARRCLGGNRGAVTVREICRNLKKAISKSETYPFYQGDLLQILLSAQPFAALQALCGDDAEELKSGVSILDQAGQLRRIPFDAIPEVDLLNWCDEQPETRYPAAAMGVMAFRRFDESGRPQWTDIARKLFEKSPDRVAVLKKLTLQFSPASWDGSYAAVVESNTRLLDDLEGYPDPAVNQFIKAEKARLVTAIEAQRHAERNMANSAPREWVEGFE